MPAAVRVFKRAYPEVDRLLSEQNIAAFLERLADEDLDAVFIRPDPACSTK
jgi:hypothetical protein